jgi:hypothetical protein
VNRGGIALAGALTAALVLVPGAAALAEEPERTGWWSKLSAGGAALPQPTTGEGELRISNGVDGPVAFSAVLYPGLGASAALLTLQVKPDQTLGTPDLLACVTQDAQWPEGGNQPYDAAPDYDCDAGSAFGELSPDGTTLTFLLDATQQDLSGAWSLALVPTPGSSTPFSLDLEKPAADAFVAQPAGSSQEPFVSSEPDADAGSGSGEPFLPDAFPAAPPGDSGSAELPPLVAGGEQAALPATAAPAPALARAAPAGAPVLLTRPAGVADDLGSERRLLALLVLAGGSAAVGYAAGQQRPGPRLLGGRARLATPAVAAAGVPEAAQDRPRGIGRFARTRDSAPRRLR